MGYPLLRKSSASSSNPSSACVNYKAKLIVAYTVIADDINHTSRNASKGGEVSRSYDWKIKAVLRYDWS